MISFLMSKIRRRTPQPQIRPILNSLTNTIGAAVDEDLRLAVLSFLADYTYNNQSGTNVQGQANPTTTGTRETFRARSHYYIPVVADHPLRHRRHSDPKSSGTHAANVNSLNVGPFIKGKLSR